MHTNSHPYQAVSSTFFMLLQAEREKEEKRSGKRKGEQAKQPYVFYMCLMTGQSGGGLK